MPALLGPGLMAASLLAVAGALKVLDPAMTVGALRSMGLPSSPTLVRVGAGVELALGVAAVAVGGAALWGLVALSYLAFAAFVLAALQRGTMLGSCGCFGREDTPPHWSHVALNVALAAVAAALAGQQVGPLVDAIADRPGPGAAVVALSVVGLYLLHALYVDLPRTWAAARATR